jgi:hypothetical protein
MHSVRAASKSLLRAIMRRLVPFVSRRPRLAALAGKLFGVMPSLRHRLRNMVSMPAALPRSERSLTAEEAGVLVDLRHALRTIHGPRR